MNLGRTFLIAVAFSLIFAISSDDGFAARRAKKKECLECHAEKKPQLKEKFVHKPFSKKECLKCHESHGFTNALKLKKVVYVLMLISIIRGIPIVTYGSFMPFVWERHGESVFLVGMLVGLFSFFGGISSYLGGRLSNYVDNRLIILLAFLPAIPCFYGAVHLYSHFKILSYILYILAGFIAMSTISINLVMGQKAAPENAGLVSGLIGGFSWGFVGLMQSPVGFLANHYGIENILIILAFTPILGAILTAFIPKEYA